MTENLENGVYFDHNGNHFAGKSGWVSAEDALLVRDINGNGQIDDGGELFGNNTELANGYKAANGFAALAEFDSNKDGVVNKNDARWAELKLWQDKNGDGKADEDEILTLEEAGVAGINVAYKNQTYIDENGNEHRQVGTFIREDGSVGQVNDVWFKTDSIDTEYKDKIEIPDDIKGLPNIRGWGSVPDMHQVMATDGGRLKALMEQYLAPDPFEGRALVWDIILAWTGMTDVDPRSYPRFNGDGRKLFAMEALTGVKFGTNPNGTFSNPALGPMDHALLEEYFAEWANKVNSYLLLSTRYSELYRLAVTGNSTYQASGDTNAYAPLMDILRAIYELGGDSGKEFAIDFIRQLRVYDANGLVCSDILKESFFDPTSGDKFISDLSTGWLNWIFGTNNTDVLSGGFGNDALHGGDWDDTLSSGSGDDILHGDGGNDSLFGGADHDLLHGDAGDDRLSGGDGNDVLWGGAGNDRLEGDSGDDIYRFGRGDGNDVVYEYESARVSKRNVISLGDGIGTDDVEFLLKQNTHSAYTDLIIRIKDTGETLTIDKAIGSGGKNEDNRYSIQAIAFADGTVWEWADIVNRPATIMDGSILAYADSLGSCITGSAANDIVYGDAGIDILHGGDGADTLYGAGGNDVLHGDGGNDLLNGGDGKDVLYGDAGDDLLRGGDGDDILWGGAGNDRLEGDFGDDVYRFGRGDGNDVVYEYEYDRASKRNVISLGEGICADDIELFLSQNSSSSAFASAYTDLLIRIKDTGETLTIDKAIGNSAENANNHYSIQAIAFADGTVWEWADIMKRPVAMMDGSSNVHADTLGSFIIGNAANNIIQGKIGADILYGGDGADTLYGAGGNDVLHGGGDNDSLSGGAGDDLLHGDSGDDMLSGGDGNDVLWGGAGNDCLEGGFGDDVYLFCRGDGGDIIYETESRPEKRNVIRLGEGIGIDDIEFFLRQNSNLYSTDFVIRIKDTGETLTVDKAIYRNRANADNSYSIQAIEFADGTVWEWADIVKRPATMMDGSDYVYADTLGSLITGNVADNTIYGNVGTDILHGGDGDDTLSGGAGNDTLWGGAGNDRLEGGAGDDVYLFGRGDGHDLVYETNSSASSTHNVLRLGEGIGIDDIEFLISNRSGNYMDLGIRIKATGETLTISRGLSDYYTSQQNLYGIQAIEFADGTVLTREDMAKKPKIMGDADLTMYTEVGGSHLIGNSLNNTLYGGAQNDILHGGGGNDSLRGGSGDDVYVFGIGDGNDTIYETESRADRRNVIRLAEGIGAEDIELLISNRSGGYMDLGIRIKSTGETLTVYRGLSEYYGNQQNFNSIQAIEFADGTVWTHEDIAKKPKILGDADLTMYTEVGGSYLVGNSKDNTLYGGSQNDILRGGGGSDSLRGGSGDDVYVFGMGDGNSTIYETETRVDRRNVIRLAEGIGVDDIELLISNRSGGYMDLGVRIKSTGETLTVYRGLSESYSNQQNSNSIQAIEFADGTVWTREDISKKPKLMLDSDLTMYAESEGSYLVGNSRDNTLYGGSGNDILHGGAGNDRLEGRVGDDVYVFGIGDGHDTISESDSRVGRRNVIRLGAGIGAGDIELLSTNRSGGYMDLVIRIKSTGETLTVYRGLSEYYANQQNSYSIQAIEFSDGTVWSYADIAKQPILSDANATSFYANADGAFLLGNVFANTMNGGSGDDILYGDAGDDRLSGGSGNDVLWGGSENDRLEGGSGDDVYRFGRGDGNDAVYEYDYGRPFKRNVISLGEGIGADDIELLLKQNSSSGYTDLIIRIKNTGETLTIDKAILRNYTNADNYYSIQAIAFADGTVWEWADIVKRPAAVMDGSSYVYTDTLGSLITGNAANDTIYGNTGTDILYGGGGADNLRGGGGDDALHGDVGDDTLYGEAGNDVLHGGIGNDTLSGGDGNDALWGGSGNDRLEGGNGDDVYRFGRGDGNDVVYEYDYGRPSKRNTISLGEGIGVDDIELILKQNSSSGYTDLVIRIKDTGETLTIDKAIWHNYTNADNYYSIQAVAFADGTVWEWADIVKRPVTMLDGSSFVYADTLGSLITGNAGDNTIYGSSVADDLHGGAGDDTLRGGGDDDILYGDVGDDTLYGESGNDMLHGGTGNDTLSGGDGNDILWGGAGNDRLDGSYGDDVYLFGRGDGNDVVYEYDYGRPSKRNVIRLGGGIGADDIELLLKQNSSSGYTDLIIRIKDTGETLTIDKAIWRNYTNVDNYYSIQAVAFADGTVWEWADIMKRPATMLDGSNYVYADTLGSFIVGNTGSNTLYGNGGSDILHGGDGIDTLSGGNGRDILYGGSGNDSLNGGDGDDTYIFQRGDGADTIIEQSGNDKLLFGEGIDLDDLWFTRSGNDLAIDILGTSDRVNIQSWFYGANYQVESISAGGMELVNTQMNQMLQAMAGFGVPAGVDGKWTEEQKEAMAPVLSNYWKPTGS